jgi:cytochrome c553
MKKVLLVVLVVAVFATLAMAQNFPGAALTTPGAYTSGTGIPFNTDKLGGHQNGGRGCVGCHAPHSGGRGNGGVMQWDSATSSYKSVAVVGDSGDDVLWGQDLGPIYGKLLNFPGSSDYATGVTGDVTITATSQARMITGVAMCLSCHDGNVAKGAMMTNKSFEQTAGLLPASYGTAPIPTLLGADGGVYGNYENDHPVGPNASLGAVGHGAIAAAKGFFVMGASSGTPVIAKSPTFAASAMGEFEKNYGLPTITGARAGAGFATDVDPTSVDKAYVVCTTCHTPHSMYTTSASGTNPIATLTKGTFPTYFFIAAPYNPAAATANGTKASSATQFCRQCHFSGPGGANEASGISIPTAF